MPRVTSQDLTTEAFEKYSSLRQDPEAPLAVQICLEKREGEKKSKTCCSQSYTAFPPGHVLYSLPFSLSDQSYKKRFMHASVCVTESGCVCRLNAGQMRTPEANLCCCGAKACFLFTPLVVEFSVCMCMWNASAARGRQTPSCWMVCIMDACCVAAAYYHLVRGEDRVVITPSSSASGCVFSPNLHAQVICRVEFVSRIRERDKDHIM